MPSKMMKIPRNPSQRGAALHAASSAGDRELVEMLLAQGADPNATIDSAGSATYAAATRDLRALLLARGGTLDPYDLVFLGEDEEALRQVAADLGSPHAGCGGAFPAPAWSTVPGASRPLATRTSSARKVGCSRGSTRFRSAGALVSGGSGYRPCAARHSRRAPTPPSC